MSASFVPTKSSLLRQQKVPEFQEVVFNSHKRKPRDESSPLLRKRNAMPEPIPKREDDQRSFMKKSRYDIIKFGMTGFDAAKREETKQALAISLGAKPAKRKGMNYKDLKEIRLKQKEESKERLAFHSLGKTASGHASAKIKNRMRANRQKPKGDHKGGLLSVYGKVKKDAIPKKLS